MSDKKFKVFHGQFWCQTCNEEVSTLRLWTDSLDITWMCSKKHISRGTFNSRKKYQK